MFDDILGDFSKKNPESVKLVKSIDFPSKTNDFQGSAASFFHVFSTHVRSFFGIEIYIDFIMILGAILAPFSTLYDPLAIILGYFFGIVFFMIFGCRFGPLLAPFESTGRNRTESQALFFQFVSCFFGASLWGSILDGF